MADRAKDHPIKTSLRPDAASALPFSGPDAAGRSRYAEHHTELPRRSATRLRGHAPAAGGIRDDEDMRAGMSVHMAREIEEVLARAAPVPFFA
jgi:hypothetical protein